MAGGMFEMGDMAGTTIVDSNGNMVDFRNGDDICRPVAMLGTGGIIASGYVLDGSHAGQLFLRIERAEPTPLQVHFDWYTLTDILRVLVKLLGYAEFREEGHDNG